MSDPSGIRTRVTAVRGRCPGPLNDGASLATQRVSHDRRERPNPAAASHLAGRFASVLADIMRLTKMPHATLVLDDSGSKLIVDPGTFSAPLDDLGGTAAVVITHEHADHWTAKQLSSIMNENPSAQIFGPPGVVSAAEGFAVTAVNDGDSVTVGPFLLRFFGSKHALIHSSIPVVDNVGVLINNALYYPGDSFTIPHGVAVNTLAVPAGAPWLKIGDVIDFVLAIAPRRSFPTHEMVLSMAGKHLSNSRIEWATRQGGGEFIALEPHDSIEL